MVGLMGCATIESIRVVNPDYSIMDRLVITLDKKKLGNKYEDVKNSIKSDIDKFKWHITDWIEQFKDDNFDVYKVLESGIKCTPMESAKDNEFGVTLEFAGIEYFRIFYGLECVTEELQDIMSTDQYYKAMTDVGPFISKISSDNYSSENMGLFLYKYYMFSDKGLMNGINDFALDDSQTYLEKYSIMSGFNMDDVEISQVFTYPDDRIKSNADEVEVVDGMTFMAWNLSDKDDGFEMEMYYVGARTTAWYVVGLIISVIAVVVIFFVVRYKHKEDIAVVITKQEVEKKDKNER